MAEYEAGVAYVSIVPSLRGTAGKIARDMRKDGADAGRAWREAFEEAAKRGRETPLPVPSPRRSREDGAESGGAFAEGFRRRVQAATRSLPPIRIGAAKSAAEQQLRELRGELESLSDQTIGVDISSADALAELERLRERLQSLDRDDATLDVRADVAAALAQLAEVEAVRRRLDGEDVDIRVDVDAARGIASLNSFTGRLTALGVILTSLAPAAVPLGGLAVATLPAIGAGATASLAGVGALALGLSGVGEAVGALAEQQTNAAQDAQDAADRQAAAAARVSSAQASLDSARRAASRSARDSERAVADAVENVGVVEERTAQQVEQARRAVTDARRDAASTAEDGDRRVASALDTLATAERSAEAAQRTALETQEAINEARQAAARDLADLADRVADGPLAQRDAELALAEAVQARREADADPTRSALERERAALRVAQAEDRLGDVQRDNQRAAEDYAQAQAAGVEGSAQVTGARQAAADAAQAQADAERAVVDATAGVDAARAQSAEANAAAQERVAESVTALSAAQVDAARAVADAQQGVTDASTRAAEAQVDSAASVEAAQRSLADALRATEEQASSSAQKVQDAFAGLSPAGAAFATYLFSLRGELDDLRDSASTALLPGLTDALEVLRPSLPAINAAVGAFAGALGDLAVAAAEALTGPAWESFFTYFAAEGPGLMVTFAEAIGRFTLGLGNLMVAFAPLTDVIAGGLANMGASFATWAAELVNSDGFQAFIDYLITNMPVMGAFIGSLADLFVTLIRSMAPMGPVILQIITGVSNFIAALPPGVIQAVVTGVAGLVAVFGYLAPAVTFVVGVAQALVAAFGAGGLAGVVAALGGPVTLIIAGVVALGAALVAAYQHSETFRGVVQGAFAAVAGAARSLWQGFLKPAFDGFVAILRNVVIPAVLFLWRNVVQPAFAGIGYIVSLWWTGVKLIFGVLVGTLTIVGRAFSALYDEYVRPKMQLLGAVVKAVWETVVRPALSALGSFIEDEVAPKFQAGVDLIQGIWEGIKSVLATPIKAVIDFVNDGIIDTYEAARVRFKLEDVVPKVDRIDYPPSLQGFARGGVLPGRSSWRDGDDQLVPMRRGEGVAISEAMEVPTFRNMLLTWNRIGLAGGKAALQRHAEQMGGLAKGGLVGGVPQGVGFAKGGVADLIAFGRALRNAGFNVGENKALGDNPRRGAHSATGYHYKADNSGAIDVNAGAGESTAEKIRLTPVALMARKLGFGVQWLAPGHYNHLHADVGSYTNIGDIGRYSANVAGFVLDKVGDLKGAALSGLLKGVLAAKGVVDFVNPFDSLKLPAIGGAVGDLGVGVLKGMVGRVGTVLRDAVGSIGGGDETEGAYSGKVGAGVEQWRGTVLQALNIMGLPASLADTTLRRMNQESGGNARAINNWDINARNGVPSKGLMQVIGPTFRANAHPDYDSDIYDPLSNILASMRYALGRYGSLPKAYNRKGGYSRGSTEEDFAGLTPTLFDGGGWFTDDMLAVHKLKTPDAVIPAAEMRVIRQAATSTTVGVPDRMYLEGEMTVNGLPAMVRGIARTEMATAGRAGTTGLINRTRG